MVTLAAGVLFAGSFGVSDSDFMLLVDRFPNSTNIARNRLEEKSGICRNSVKALVDCRSCRLTLIVACVVYQSFLGVFHCPFIALFQSETVYRIRLIGNELDILTRLNE